MRLARVFERTNGNILIWDTDDIGDSTPADGTLLFEFSIDEYPGKYATIANSDNRAWNGSDLSLGGEVYLNAAWIAVRQSEISNQQANEPLQTLTRDDAIGYFRRELANAAGNGAALASLYSQARGYEQDNPMLTNTMLTLRTIEETTLGISLNLTTNQDKARYLKLFLMALALWS